MDRTHFDADHLAFADSARTFCDKTLVPHYLQWEEEGLTPREVFLEAGSMGFLAMAVPAEYGGMGVTDFRFNQVLDEQLALAGVTGSGLGISLHNDICLPYFLTCTNSEQKQRWLPGIVAGTSITAVAMTEPGAGSDLAGIRTRAVRDGDDFIVNGAKTFITNGINADLVVVAVVTGDTADRHGNISLLVLERGMPGFERGRNLAKIGMHSQDTAELSFSDVRVPAANLLGDVGSGFAYLTGKLAQERLSIAINALGEADAAFRDTVRYVGERSAFGKSIGSFQNSKFTLAELSTGIDVAQAYIDRCVQALNGGQLSAADAARAKLHCSELQGRVVDQCLQLFGGYGYMAEYPIARRYVDARVTRIYGGTSEIMKSVIAKSLGL